MVATAIDAATTHGRCGRLQLRRFCPYMSGEESAVPPQGGTAEVPAALDNRSVTARAARWLPARASRRLSRNGVDPSLLALLRRNRRRRTRQRVVSGGSLREGDHVPDSLPAGQQHQQPVPAERDATVRRRPEPQRVKQEAELRRRLVARQADHVEDLLLHVRTVDT